MSDRKKRKISSDNESLGTDQLHEEKQSQSDQSKESVHELEENIDEFFQEENEQKSDKPQKLETEIKEQPQIIKMESLKVAINNLNLARKNSNHDQHEFDLETVYKNEQEFELLHGDDESTLKDFELKDISFPHERNADYLFMVVMNVFSNPVNCTYFFKSELELIFSLFSLSPQAQMLFVRLLKRKLTWHRISSLKYPEVAKSLEIFFKELSEKNFCSLDIQSVDITVLLNMLQIDEIRDTCKKLKIDHKGNKTDLMGRLLKYGNTKKSFFTGAKSANVVLRSTVCSLLGPCVTLSESSLEIFDRILTLFFPTQDPSENISDLFFMISGVHQGDILYPPIENNKFFPVFKSRSHLIDFVKSKNAVKDEINFIEKKEWNSVQDLGRLALDHLLKGEKKNEKSSVPSHVKKFEPEYSWMKVLSKSIDAFKKFPETIPEAVKLLKTLINDEHFSQSSKGRWYRELALIEMHHCKNLEESAALALHALKEVKLSDVDVSDLIERLRKLIRRKTGISKETKKKLEEAHEELRDKGLAPAPSANKTIYANMANKITNAGKSKWSININGRDKFYGSVEVLVLQHYTSEEDFHQGLHVEGSLPVTLFGIFFWDELYSASVPGVFLSPYQDSPLDLYTAQFYNNRKQLIDDKIKFIRALDEETFADWMHERYVKYHLYRSLVSNELFKDDEQFRDVVRCLGITGVTGICERLVSNFVLWRSGFPDLIVWNKLHSTCKIVEVKGPGDTLSEKQKHWLQYLKNVGVDAEVCHVEAAGSDSK